MCNIIIIIIIIYTVTCISHEKVKPLKWYWSLRQFKLRQYSFISDTFNVLYSKKYDWQVERG
jgi:hypothetical protein